MLEHPFRPPKLSEQPTSDKLRRTLRNSVKNVLCQRSVNLSLMPLWKAPLSLSWRRRCSQHAARYALRNSKSINRGEYHRPRSLKRFILPLSPPQSLRRRHHWQLHRLIKQNQSTMRFATTSQRLDLLGLHF